MICQGKILDKYVLLVYDALGVKEKGLTGRRDMDALEMTLLFDYYGDLLTDRQRMCFDLRHNQDLSLAEIAEELNVSRQGVHDNLNRAEALLRNMEEKTGCVRRDMSCRNAVKNIASAAQSLAEHGDVQVSKLAREILIALQALEE